MEMSVWEPLTLGCELMSGGWLCRGEGQGQDCGKSPELAQTREVAQTPGQNCSETPPESGKKGRGRQVRARV